MIIDHLRVNHIETPMGYAMDRPVLSWLVTQSSGKTPKSARIRIAEDADMERVVFDSGMRGNISSLGYALPHALRPAFRYWWNVAVEADDGDYGCSKAAWFETPAVIPELAGEMIGCERASDVCEFFKTVVIEGDVRQARIYVTALGIFELRINGKRVGEEYLTPYCNDYDSWQQVITFDVADYLKRGENELSAVVAPGWYSGYFGFEGKNKTYGERLGLFLNLTVTYEDGTVAVTATDERWQTRECEIRSAEIYHGEVYDPNYVPDGEYAAEVLDFDKSRLEPRRSLPVIVKERLTPKRILHTPKGETVVDLGQNMVGWMAFRCAAPKGTKICLRYGEVLQDGCFYRENLRSAKAEFTYISDGEERWVRPHLTFYGFRYVKVEGWSGELKAEDFVGEVIYSDMDITGHVETGNPLVNRLFLNALWGQKGNFVDVPTDCPQRDERMGWTGDAQIFCGTAAFNMDTYAFYSKYGYDMLREQEGFDGCVPMVIPSFHMRSGGSSAWADAATVIPWTQYVYSGDRAILEQQYPSMKLWLEYIRRQDDGRRLWQSGFHFGDWLALDGDDPTLPTGATEQFYVASAYYFLSATLTAKAARVLGKTGDAEEYEVLAGEVKAAMRAEYFTENGRLAVPTQSGYVIALAFGFCPEEYKARVAADLHQRLRKDQGKLRTGFVGTPYLCKVLSEYGYNEMAYTLLLNEDCPGWLYPVRMGATTIWERWDSILPDGTINPEGMNSLNHYSYGAVAEWMYRWMGGINPVEEEPGFVKIRWSPRPDYRMSTATVRCRTAAGTYESSWRIEGDKLRFRLTVPFGCTVQADLPDAPEGVGGGVLTAGTHEIVYVPTRPYVKRCSAEMLVSELFAVPEARACILAELPHLAQLSEGVLKSKTLMAMAYDHLLYVPMEKVQKLDEALRAFTVRPDVIPDMIMDI